jgi:uncharacterized membrane protein
MGKIFLRGLLAIAPITITIILIIWLYNHLEYIFGGAIAYFFPDIYFPGLGIIVAALVLFLLGLLLNHLLMQRIYNYLEKSLKKIPLLKTIYTSVTDLMSFFNAGNKDKKNLVVMVDLGGIRMMGLVTRESFNDLPNGVGTKDDIVVFFPFSYQIGGFTAVVPKSLVKPVDLSVEKGLRFMATAGNPGDGK